MVNSFRVAATRWEDARPNDEFFDAADVGVRNYYTGYQPHMVTIQGGGAGGSGSLGFQLGSTAPNKTGNHSSEIVDDLSFTRGDHQFAFGGKFATLGAKTNISLFGLGDFRFTGEFTGLGSTDFLAGKLSRLTQSGTNSAYMRQRYAGF